MGKTQTTSDVSLAVETSCRAGGLALGAGGRCVEAVAFDADGRHATALISRAKALLDSRGLTPADVSEIYVSIGPGGFTGLRVGITAVRTFAQALGAVRCVAVPTAGAVARNAAGLEWRYLGVILAARGDRVYATVFERRHGRIVEVCPGRDRQADEFLADAPRPITLIGEGLAYRAIPDAAGVTSGDPEDPHLHLPDPRAVWQVGYEMARAGQFTEYPHLLPLYARKPEAVRLWEGRNKHPEASGTEEGVRL